MEIVKYLLVILTLSLVSNGAILWIGANKTSLENERKKSEIISYELKIKKLEQEKRQIQLKIENKKLEVENIRFEAFMRGYKNKEYVIEILK